MSFILIDIGLDTNRQLSWNVGIGGPLSFNFGSDGVYLKGESELYKYTVETSVGFSDNNSIFFKTGSSYEVSKNFSSLVKYGAEIDINYDKVACAFARVCGYAVLVVIAGAGVVATPYTRGASTAATAAAMCILLLMISNENNSGDNILC